MATNASASFAPNFSAITSAYGADGPGTTTGGSYTLGIIAGPSGLIDVATGQSVTLSLNGNTVEGHIASGNALVFSITVDSFGLVTLDQLRAVQHPDATNPNDAVQLAAANLVNLSQSITVTDRDGDTSTATAKLDIGSSFIFKDDGPTATNIHVTGIGSIGAKTNIELVIDISGSMAEAAGVGSMTRMDLQKNAILELIEQYEALGPIAVRVVTFSTSASTIGNTWSSSPLELAALKVSILALQPTNTTNYDDALNTAWNAFESPGKISDAQNILYFFSDGIPNASNLTSSPQHPPLGGGNGIDSAETAAWEGFLNTNDINSFAIGLGTGAVVSELNPIAFNGFGAGTNTNAIVVTDLSQLDATILSTITSLPINGNLITDPNPDASFGADNGWVKSITIDGTTYNKDGSFSGTSHGTYDAINHIWDINLLGNSNSNNGNYKIDMDNAAYTYTPPSSITGAINEIVGFILIDRDGDTAGANLTIDISANGASVLVVRDDFVLTNQPTSSGVDQISIPQWTLLANDTGGTGVPTMTAVSSEIGGSAAMVGSNVIFTETSNSDNNGGRFSYTNTTGTDAATASVELTRDPGNGTLTGTFRNEVLVGRENTADVLNSGDGDDVISGLGGNDNINGGTGKDILSGNLGVDVLTGGTGADKFMFFKGEGGSERDTITDFITGTDTIVINGSNIQSVVVNTDSPSGTTNNYTIHITYTNLTTEDFKVALSNSKTLSDAGGSPSIQITASTATIDGTIVGATLYLDVNHNNHQDQGEWLGVSNQNGEVQWVLNLNELDNNHDSQFTIGEARAVQTGGIDASTGISYDINLYGQLGGSVITPLSSLLQTQLEAGVEFSHANESLAAHMGLASGSDLSTLNPLESNNQTLALNGAVMTVAVQFAELAALHLGSNEAQASFPVFQAIADVLENLANGEQANFSDAGLLSSIAQELNLGSLFNQEILDFMVASQHAIQYSMEGNLSSAEALTALSAVQHLTQGSYAQVLESVSTGTISIESLGELTHSLDLYGHGNLILEQLSNFDYQLRTANNDSKISSAEFDTALAVNPIKTGDHSSVTSNNNLINNDQVPHDDSSTHSIDHDNKISTAEHINDLSNPSAGSHTLDLGHLVDQAIAHPELIASEAHQSSGPWADSTVALNPSTDLGHLVDIFIASESIPASHVAEIQQEVNQHFNEPSSSSDLNSHGLSTLNTAETHQNDGSTHGQLNHEQLNHDQQINLHLDAFDQNHTPIESYGHPAA